MSDLTHSRPPVTDREVEIYKLIGALDPGDVEDVMRLYECFCGERVAYVRALDRFMHISGTENRHCWQRFNDVALHVGL